jgi:predicted DsbA family dithiol-disulfide isomerase
VTTQRLEGLGVTVTPLPFELHPELGPEGRAVRPDGRLAALYGRIGELCAEAGLAFTPPTRVRNTRYALEAVEVVRVDHPSAFRFVDDMLFAAAFAEARDIGDPEVVDAVVTAAGVESSAVRARVETGVGRRAVGASMARAYDHGIAATPAWLVEDRLVIPGVQPFELVERWVAHLRSQVDHPPSSPG